MPMSLRNSPPRVDAAEDAAMGFLQAGVSKGL